MQGSKLAYADQYTPSEKRQLLRDINGNLKLEGIESPKEVNLMQEDWIKGRISTEEMFKRFEKIVLKILSDKKL